MILDIIGTIIFGAVIGVLARLIMPGKQNISVLWTVLLGALGAIVGYLIMGGPDDDGSIDWLRWAVSIIAAIVFVAIYGAISGRKSTRD